MKNKQKKKRNKKYQSKKFSNRLQYREGQRVAYAQGGVSNGAFPIVGDPPKKDPPKKDPPEKDPGGGEEIPETLSFDEQRDIRVTETGQSAEEIASGIMPENLPTAPLPKTIPRSGTEIGRRQIDETLQIFGGNLNDREYYLISNAKVYDY